MKIFPGSILLILKAQKFVRVLEYSLEFAAYWAHLYGNNFFSFINCYLNYATIAWTSTNKSKLQPVYCHQKHAARIINFKDKFTPAKPLLEQINAITVYEMNIFQTLCFKYICKNGNTSSIFKHIYKVKPINKYTIRSKNIFFKPLCKKNFAKFKWNYRGPHLWNKFIASNNDLLETVTIHIFKIRLKKIIFASTNILEDFWNYFHINWSLLNSTQGKSY